MGEQAQRLRERLQQLQEDTETVVAKKRMAIKRLGEEVVRFEEKAAHIAKLLEVEDDALLVMLGLVEEAA